MLQLALVAEALPRRAGTAVPIVVAADRHPVGARLDHLDRARVGEVALGLGHLRNHGVAGEAALDEYDVALPARQARTALCDALDAQLEPIAAAGPRRLRRRGRLAGAAVHLLHPAMPATLDLDSYASQAEAFIGEMDREYYEHFAGHKTDFEIEAIYERHESLFSRDVVEHLRELRNAAPAGDEHRRLRYLLELAAGGLIGRETKEQEAEFARREAQLEIEIDGRREAYRQASIVQANEPDPERRHAIERARLDVLDAELNPLHRIAIERTPRRRDRTGWESYRAMCADLKCVDLAALERQTSAFSEATSATYRETLEPQFQRQLGFGFDRLRRSDLSYFFRAPEWDALFPEDKLMSAFERTLAGLGIDLAAQTNVHLDTEQRPQKSPRAFCCPVGVPGEVYLVIPRVGGRDDFSALFHEGGHTEHYANVAADLPFEFRYLGDNSVTECFAFLLEHLVEDPTWLRGARGRGHRRIRRVRAFLQVPVPAPLLGQARLRDAATRRRALPGRDAGPLHAASQRRRRGLLAARDLPRRTWTKASMRPTTCAPGRSRRICAGTCASGSASAGSRSERQAISCAACGGRDSGSTATISRPRSPASSSTSA